MRSTEIVRFIHERLNEEKTASVFLMILRQADGFRPLEALRMVGDMQFNFGRCANCENFHLPITGPWRSALDRVVARLGQGEFTGRNLFVANSLLFEKAAHFAPHGTDFP